MCRAFKNIHTEPNEYRRPATHSWTVSDVIFLSYLVYEQKSDKIPSCKLGNL